MSGGLAFPVSQEKVTHLRQRMQKLGIREEELSETFITSQGKGGQNVNKVATCVVLVHEPTGMRIKCQQARTQGLNRYLARKLLVEKIEAVRLGEKSEKEQAIARIQRQKRRRSRRAKNRMLADKHKKSSVKAMRGHVASHGEGD
jgi:peptide chain release factor